MVGRICQVSDWLERRIALFGGKRVLLSSNDFSVCCEGDNYFLLMQHVSVLESDGLALMVPKFMSGILVALSFDEVSQILKDGVSKVWFEGTLVFADSPFEGFKVISLERLADVNFLSKVG